MAVEKYQIVIELDSDSSREQIIYDIENIPKQHDHVKCVHVKRMNRIVEDGNPTER